MCIHLVLCAEDNWFCNAEVIFDVVLEYTGGFYSRCSKTELLASNTDTSGFVRFIKQVRQEGMIPFFEGHDVEHKWFKSATCL
jgi:hypothetical protein